MLVWMFWCWIFLEIRVPLSACNGFMLRCEGDEIARGLMGVLIDTGLPFDNTIYPSLALLIGMYPQKASRVFRIKSADTVPLPWVV